MEYRAPAWVRALLALDRIAMRANNVREGILDELLLAWVRPEDRPALTSVVYGSQATYLPGGTRFQGGLFDWERRVLDAPPFPRSGRVLVGAAGAGREMVGLLERGFSVVAFDPCAPFVNAARTVAAGATVVQASYADLVEAVERRAGPLGFLCSEPPFDAVVLGWGSFSHVMPASARFALLSALRALAPRAPVLFSFALEAERGAAPQNKGRVRGTLQRLFAALKAPGVSEVGDHFLSNGGFFSFLTQAEVMKLAWNAGYEIARFEEHPYSHAVLVPLGAPGDRGEESRSHP